MDKDCRYKIVLPDNVEFFIEHSILEKIPKLFEMSSSKAKDESGCYIINIEIEGQVFSQILTFVRYRLIEREDRKFVDKMIKSMTIDNLFDLIIAAKSLEVHELVKLSSDYFKKIIHDNEVPKIRTIFNLKNDLSESDDEVLKQDYRWSEFSQ